MKTYQCALVEGLRLYPLISLKQSSCIAGARQKGPLQPCVLDYFKPFLASFCCGPWYPLLPVLAGPPSDYSEYRIAMRTLSSQPFWSMYLNMHIRCYGHLSDIAKQQKPMGNESRVMHKYTRGKIGAHKLQQQFTSPTCICMRHGPLVTWCVTSITRLGLEGVFEVCPLSHLSYATSILSFRWLEALIDCIADNSSKTRVTFCGAI